MGFLYGFHPKANRGLAGALEVIGNWVFFFASQKTLHPSFQSYYLKQDSTQSWRNVWNTQHWKSVHVPLEDEESPCDLQWNSDSSLETGVLRQEVPGIQVLQKHPGRSHCQRVKGKISCVFSAETFAKQTSFWRDRSYFPLRHDY